jgi:hypothetical protein
MIYLGIPDSRDSKVFLFSIPKAITIRDFRF